MTAQFDAVKLRLVSDKVCRRNYLLCSNEMVLSFSERFCYVALKS